MECFYPWEHEVHSIRGQVISERDVPGRALIEKIGIILAVDAPFCAILERTEAELVGANLLDYTAYSDRERAGNLMRAMLADPRPLTTMKRVIRPCGTHFWVRLELTQSLRYRDPQYYDIVVEPAAAPEGWVEPGKLLALARIVLSSRHGRRMVFDDDMFADYAWDILILAYIREAEGEIVTIASIHAETGMSLSNASRWLRALAASGLVEYEDKGTTSFVTVPFRLSAIGHSRFETYLTDTYHSFNHRKKTVMP